MQYSSLIVNTGLFRFQNAISMDVEIMCLQLGLEVKSAFREDIMNYFLEKYFLSFLSGYYTIKLRKKHEKVIYCKLIWYNPIGTNYGKWCGNHMR